MKIQSHKPTSTERKKGRATCQCGKPAVLIYGEKPNAHPVCEEHNKEYVDGINKLIEASKVRQLEDFEKEELKVVGGVEPVRQYGGSPSMALFGILAMAAALGSGYPCPPPAQSSRRRR